MFWLGISAATSVRVGFYIGSGQEREAKITALYCVFISVFTGVLMSFVFFFGRSFFADVFSKDEHVQEISKGVLALVSCWVTFDSMNNVSGGILKALGNTYAICYKYDSTVLASINHV